MCDSERVREILSGAPAPDYFQQKIAQGWRPVSIEWERPVEQPKTDEPEVIEEIPFGLQIADDCQHLREDASEKSALMFMMELIVQDEPLTRIADQLNQQGYRNRNRERWTPGQVFDLLPRLVDVGPRILTNNEYIARKHFSTNA